ncbi:MAG: tRNA (adenosine(37)-N6)-threonylcarbamoyltransferase complex ATPase subunit type 1 TsaE [Oxalobacter sp.]|nr:MAG: tRNA (adenosine(37)-N6)-threonylcarbamoyltransferase complex ATPase subunit type 1 TsaE [Oxalobacter sp.]
MTHHLKFSLHEEAGTLALGVSLARVLVPGLAIYLRGELGAGKTTLARALLHAAGHQGHVKSPTYTLCEPYALTLNGQPVELFHFDLYRMKSAEEFVDAGFRDHFNGANICIVEWPENGGTLLPQPDITLVLTASGTGRQIELSALTDKGTQCLKRLDFAPNL